MRKIDFKEEALWVYDKTLEILLIVCLLLAMAFTSTIEFLRQTNFKKLLQESYKKSFSYLPKINLPKKK